MSIENDLKKIAEATAQTAKSVAELVNILANKAPAQQADTPVAPAQQADTPVAPNPPKLIAMSPEEVNEVLVAEFKRLGTREPIDAAMADLGINSVLDLPADKQHELIERVKSIPTPGQATA